MNKDEELTRYMSIIEQYKEQISSLETQISYVQAAILDYNKAKITIEQLLKTDKNSDVLLPIGGSSFIYAKVINPSSVLFDIGAGIITEKQNNDAISKIEKRIENLEKTQEKMYSMIENLQKESSEISQKAQKLISEEKK
jgi:prefoldin alpha subunit